MSEARVQQFARLVAQQPGNELFRFSLAQALESAGRTDEALPHLQQCAAAKPDWMMPRILLGKALLRRGQRAAARPWLASALELAIAQDHEDPAAELQTLLADLD